MLAWAAPARDLGCLGIRACLQLGRLVLGVRCGWRLPGSLQRGLALGSCTLAGFGGIWVGWGAGLDASRWHSGMHHAASCFAEAALKWLPWLLHAAAPGWGWLWWPSTVPELALHTCPLVSLLPASPATDPVPHILLPFTWVLSQPPLCALCPGCWVQGHGVCPGTPARGLET